MKEGERDMEEPWKKLEGKVVMVTGASSGLGHEFCLVLAKLGCRIVAAARRFGRLKSLCEEINAPGFFPDSTLSVRAVAVELDVAGNGDVIDASVRRAWDAFGHIDALVNNAGVRGGVYSPLDWSEEDWNTNFKTNVAGLWLVSKSMCKLMRDAGQKGSVINITSVAGVERGQLPGSLAYSASKTAANAVTKVMALEMGPYNIRVNSICPGIFKSEITEGLMQKKWLSNVARKTVPLRSFGTSDPALTSLVCYLIHDSSAYITGNVFVVDLGASLPGIPIFSSL
ncbi:hypothetical protein HPP92_000437 [Vanilla planifolia]|uniref:Noroxomaritidine/norcraugsodine reductase n=1 Tax=Vanilla planifolia TaxID=51239 RepID=A0A835VKG1_VANPL|nr:hypothetical protein HPP92_000437 [Vanilla planifolia]